MVRVVLWFRGNDLRVHDHAPLREAQRRVAQGRATGEPVEVVPVYCFDPR